MIGLIDTVLDLVKTPMERLIPDKDMRYKLEHAMKDKMIEAGLAQTKINQTEAMHQSIFVAGWRPFVGWVCGCALLWHFILYDLLNWLRVIFLPHSPVPPALSGTETLVTILLSMLGLGGLRTVEKLRGVGRKSL